MVAVIGYIIAVYCVARLIWMHELARVGTAGTPGRVTRGAIFVAAV